MKSKPDENYEDPADVAAIKDAQANTGDFKLKTAPDYVVPEHLRIDTEKKRFQMLILEGMVRARTLQILRGVRVPFDALVSYNVV